MTAPLPIRAAAGGPEGVRPVRERGIIFTGPNVLAIMAGRKTQTRRVLKPQPREWTAQVIDISTPMRDEDGVWGQVRTEWSAPSFDMPRGEPEREFWEPLKLVAGVGDHLWVRETWKPHSTFAGVPPRDIPPSKVFYAADDSYVPSGTPWRSPIHMPRWASRLTLAVTDVRVQRLQDISEADALAEGVEPVEAERDHRDWSICPDCGGTGLHGSLGQHLGYVEVDCSSCRTHRDRYRHLWNSIHGPGSWDLNSWVAAVTFERLPAPASDPGAAP